ncbi:MAG: hypothetical protein ACOC8N_02000 [Spirochaetota bacterium]
MERIVIQSITTPGLDFVPLPSSRRCRGVLKLSFHDISKKIKGRVSFRRKHARAIKRFLARHDAPLLISQCDYGASRSAGVAAAVSRVHRLDHERYFNQQELIPNLLVFESLLKAYHVRYSKDEIAWYRKLYVHKMKQLAGIVD